MIKFFTTCFILLEVLFACSVFGQENKAVIIPLGSGRVPGNLKTVSVSAFAGMPEFEGIVPRVAYSCSSYAGVYDGGGTGSTQYLFAPVQLPDGATITSFKAVICDNTPSYGGSMALYRSDSKFIAAALTSIAEASTTPFTKDADSITSDYATVDNSKYSYFIKMSVNSAAGTNLYPITAIITLE
ncbi:MAG: hypothetical protein Kow0089_12420 [Desulfobulbaceae bacterium]